MQIILLDNLSKLRYNILNLYLEVEYLMDGAADGSNPDNYYNNIVTHIILRHSLHHYLC